MRVARTAQGLAHRNTLVLQAVKIYFQQFPGKAGSDANRGVANLDWKLHLDGRVVNAGKTTTDGSLTVHLPAEGSAELEILGTRYKLVLNAELEKVTDLKGQQRRLAMLGYELGEVDGNYGRKTDTQVLNFQADTGLDPDGVIGNKTRTKMTSEFGE